MQVRYQYLFSIKTTMSLQSWWDDVLTLPYSYNGKRQKMLEKRWLCKVLLGRPQIRCSDDVVFEISSDVSIAPIC